MSVFKLFRRIISAVKSKFHQIIDSEARLYRIVIIELFHVLKWGTDKIQGIFFLIFSSSVSRRETQCEINTKHSPTNVEEYSAGCSNTHKKAEMRSLFFPVYIFRTLDKLFDSVNNAESHDIKNSTVFRSTSSKIRNFRKLRECFVHVDGLVKTILRVTNCDSQYHLGSF